MSLILGHQVCWSLIEFIFGAQLLRLAIFFHFVVAGRNKGWFVRSCQQFLIVDVLGGAWYHFKNVEMLFLPELHQFAEFFSSRLLHIGRLMVYHVGSSH